LLAKDTWLNSTPSLAGSSSSPLADAYVLLSREGASEEANNQGRATDGERDRAGEGGEGGETCGMQAVERDQTCQKRTEHATKREASNLRDFP